MNSARNHELSSGRTRHGLHRWPKIELHRHLEGCVRFQTAWKWAQTSPALAGLSHDALRQRIEFDGVRNFTHFLNRFAVLRQLYTCREAIEQVAWEAVEDAAAEHIRYLELRFSPDHFASYAGFDMEAVTTWILNVAGEAARAHNIRVRYVLTIARNYDEKTAAEILAIALRHRDRGVVGLDLAGNELLYPDISFADLFARAREEGLGVTVHAGEAGSAASVWKAVEELGAHRIGHGIRSVDDAHLLRVLRERRIALEVCLTSNVQTGVVPSLLDHPLPRLVRAGVPLTLCSDDPRISHITLTDEWRNALDLGLSIEQLVEFTVQAVEHAFLTPGEKQELRRALMDEVRALLLDSPLQ
ncbi:MAG: adenosine deaminase [Ardenticatenia bacterium]|nr:adenosine deaminase [Ardenticatenia bacterium]